MLNIFSYVYFHLLPSFACVLHFLVELVFFIRCDFCKYFLPVWSFSYFLDSVFQGHKSLPYSRSLRFSPRSFIVLHIIFRYMIHFELIFLRGVRSLFRFFFKNMWMFSCPSTICWKGCLFSMYFLFAPLSKIS